MIFDFEGLRLPEELATQLTIAELVEFLELVNDPRH